MEVDTGGKELTLLAARSFLPVPILVRLEARLLAEKSCLSLTPVFRHVPASDKSDAAPENSGAERPS